MSTRFSLKKAEQIIDRLGPLFLIGSKGERKRFTGLSETHKADLREPSNWNWRSGIYAVAIGEKVTERKTCHGEFCLKFFVPRKIARTRLRSSEAIPTQIKLRSTRSKILTDVEEMQNLPTGHSAQIFRPVRPGASIGNFRGSTGTAGLIVRRIGFPNPLILSCSHVLALGGFATAGDPVEQPADFSGTVGPNRIGRLFPGFSVLNPAVINDVDAAVAAVDQGISIDPAILDIGLPTRISDPFSPLSPNLAAIPLLRSGAATGVQPGSIVGLRAKVKVQMPAIGGHVIVFSRMVLYKTHSQAGDSGAAVIDARDTSIVGLHVAGNGIAGLFTPIQAVFNALGVELA